MAQPVSRYYLPVQNWLAEESPIAPFEQLGLLPWRPQTPILINQIAADSPASRADLRQDDLITHLNGEPIDEYLVFVEQIRSMPGALVDIRLERAGTLLEKPIVLDTLVLDDGSSIGRIGLGAYPPVWPEHLLLKVDLTGWQALQKGVVQVLDLMQLILNFLGQMITGKVSSDY